MAGASGWGGGIGSTGALVVIALAVLGLIAGTLHRDANATAQQRLLDAKQALANEKATRIQAERELYDLKDKVNNKQHILLELYHKIGLEAAQSKESSRQEARREEVLFVEETGLLSLSSRCNDEAQTPQEVYDKLPVYVFVCGIEGAGHHAMETVLEELKKMVNLSVTTYNPGLHSFAKHPNVSRAYQFPSIDLEKHHRTFSNFITGPKVQGRKLIFDTRNSYPEGFGVGSLGHPDLAFLSTFDGKLFELRVLVLYRDPVASVLSAVRRFKVQEFQYKNYQYQARVVQESLTMINNGLSTIPCGKSFILPYESLLKNPLNFADELSALFGVEKSDMVKCFGKLKAQPKKSVQGDVVEMKAHLTEFFSVQQRLWPNIVSYRDHIPLNIKRKLAQRNEDNVSSIVNLTDVTTPVRKHRSNSTNLEANSSSRKNYLKITYYTNLGFNNMRFIMEEALYLAKLLDRKLILTPRLRMRRCTNTDICDATDCTVIRDSYWCPIPAFLSWSALSSAGAVIIQQENTFMKGKSVISVEGAFDDMFNKSTLYLDKLPQKVKSRLTTDGKFDGKESFKFSYYKFQLGCELSYFKKKKVVWNSVNEAQRALQIKGFVETYGHYDQDILHLKGMPHFIGLTPTFWSSEAALNESESIWKGGIAYHASIVATAKGISDELISMGKAKSYMCVHLRRGDFVSAGWLGEAKDLELVKQNILKRRLKGEMIYMATDEQNATTLKMFHEIGVRTWPEFSESVASRAKGKHAKMIAFEDYVGLVEQMICAKARLFVGSKCSSFTGGILNLRRNILGDHSYYITTK